MSWQSRDLQAPNLTLQPLLPESGPPSTYTSVVETAEVLDYPNMQFNFANLAGRGLI